MSLQLFGGQVPLNTFSPNHYINPSIATTSLLTPTLPTTATAKSLTTTAPFVVADDESTGLETQARSRNKITHKPVNSETDVSTTNNSIAEDTMKVIRNKTIIGVLSTLITYISLNSYFRPNLSEPFLWQDEGSEASRGGKSSRSWLEQTKCRYLGVCGNFDTHLAGETYGHRSCVNQKQEATADPDETQDWRNAWTEGNNRPEDWTTDERILREIPDYVMEYAPLVHLYSGEQFWPCDIAEHLYHVTPTVNYTRLEQDQQHLTLHNLDELNRWNHSRYIYLTSDDNVEERPEWLEGDKNIPDDSTSPDDSFEDNDGWIHRPGRTYLRGLQHAVHDLKDWFASGDVDLNGEDYKLPHMKAAGKITKDKQAAMQHEELKRKSREAPEGGQHRLRGGRSDAPAVLVVVNKGHGIVDAFWFYFYSFNLGNIVFNVRFGNHVGDWEHTAMRFHHGKPKAVFFSEHNFGSAYSFDAVEKIGKRPVVYSAVGTHAMYATSGLHPYVLPWGILHDQTDRGPLWDPALNSHAYTYDYKNDSLRPSNMTPQAPTEWFFFAGRWGDKHYPMGDKRQYRFAGQYHYVSGPLGPRFKNLGRKKICGGPDSAPCIIKNWLGGTSELHRWHNTGEDAE